MSRLLNIVLPHVVVTVVSVAGAAGALFMTTFAGCWKVRDPSPLCDSGLSMPLMLGAAAVPLAVGVHTAMHGLRDDTTAKAYRPLVAAVATGVLGAVAFAVTG